MLNFLSQLSLFTLNYHLLTARVDLPASYEFQSSAAGGIAEPEVRSCSDEDYIEEVNMAIINSLYEQDQDEEEQKMVREIIKLSMLESKKQNGEITNVKDQIKEVNHKNKSNLGNYNGI